jgi:penicillin-binding protein 2
LKQIRDALAGVVTEGTATRAKSSIVTIAGKTGTAQTAALRTGPEQDIPKKFRDHAWFVAFAPVENPKIAVAVLAEHMGHGGSAAAPLAKEVIETYVKLESKTSAGGVETAAAVRAGGSGAL